MSAAVELGGSHQAVSAPGCFWDTSSGHLADKTPPCEIYFIVKQFRKKV